MKWKFFQKKYSLNREKNLQNCQVTDLLALGQFNSLDAISEFVAEWNNKLFLWFFVINR